MLRSRDDCCQEVKLLRRWIKRERPVGRGRTYSPALRHRILAFVDLATAAGIGKRECCEAIGVSRKAIAAWRHADTSVKPTEIGETPVNAVHDALVKPARAQVPVEVMPPSSTIRFGAAFSFVSPRGYRVEGLSLEQAVALLREFE